MLPNTVPPIKRGPAFLIEKGKGKEAVGKKKANVFSESCSVPMAVEKR